jgi:hypothetical protein
MSQPPNKSQILEVPFLQANLSPLAFRFSAKHYYKCKQDFICPDKFSVVPYFLLCRSIELSIKARHLKQVRQKTVKDSYGHNLMKAYTALKPKDRILSETELKVLKEADDIYHDKGFEYFVPEHAMRGYKNFPDLIVLDQIAKKFLQKFRNPRKLVLD